MATRKKPPRPWEIDDLEDLGRQGELYLKAIPVLILEKWVREKRQEGKANYIRTKELARHLVSRKFVAGFKPRGTSALGSVLVRMQNSRNLTAPPLIELRVRGTYWINLPHMRRCSKNTARDIANTIRRTIESSSQKESPSGNSRVFRRNEQCGKKLNQFLQNQQHSENRHDRGTLMIFWTSEREGK